MKNIELIQAHTSNFRLGRVKRRIEYIVIHYTANDNDTARNNCLYFKNNKGLDASAHYFVDSKETIQSVLDTDTAYSVGKQYGLGGKLKDVANNSNTLNIEMCSFKDEEGKYQINPKTLKRTQELTKKLMHKYGIGIDKVVRHYDVCNKRCPEPFVREDKQWADFKEGLIDKVVVSEWAKEAQEYVIKEGLSDGTRPKDLATREEIWTIAYRMR